MTKVKKNGIYLIPCRAEPGMFKDEFLVYVTAIDPADRAKTVRVQMLVDGQDVRLSANPTRRHPVDGYLQVMLKRSAGTLAEVVLPQPAAPLGEHVLIDRSNLQEVRT